jgi:hypothetical protein
VFDLEFIWKTPGSFRDNTVWNDSNELTDARHKHTNLDQIAARFTPNLPSFRQPTASFSPRVHLAQLIIASTSFPLSLSPYLQT